MTISSSTLFVIPWICYPNILYFIICRNILVLSFPLTATVCIMARCFSMLVAGLWLKSYIFDIYGLLPTTTIGWIIGIPSIISGQVLNIAVFITLGMKGVYYGKELGVLRDIRYYTGFPFSVISQPQYSGAILTIFGCMIVWGIKSDYTINYDLLVLSTTGICSYIFSIKVENKYVVPQNYKIY